MSPTRRTLAQRRSDAAPLALVLAGWALAVAPIAHPLLAHGVPFLRDAADERWVQHESDPHGQPRGPQHGHSHAPGAPEHLQVPALAATLPRRWSQEQPQAP